jgi:parvulin-like peptidyl-prolyl isomerase
VRAIFFLVAALLGIVAGMWIGNRALHSFPFRKFTGHLSGRGEMAALVENRGIYDRDIDRNWTAELYLVGSELDDIDEAIARRQKSDVLERLIADEALNAASTNQKVPTQKLDSEYHLLPWSLGETKLFLDALKRARLNSHILRQQIEAAMRERDWLEAQAGPVTVSDDEAARRYFDAEQARFQQPRRLRANHLFLAAPTGYPSDVVETKRTLIEALARRIKDGESFADLVAEYSEDEATKGRGGDLNYFAASRMLPAFFDAAAKLQIGEISAPVQTPLGFHLIQVSADLPPRTLTFEEARTAIAQRLSDLKRQTVMRDLLDRARRRVKIFRQASSPPEV